MPPPYRVSLILLDAPPESRYALGAWPRSVEAPGSNDARGYGVVSVLRCGSGTIFFSHSGGAAVKPPRRCQALASQNLNAHAKVS